MLQYALIFFIVALIAAVFGFTGIAAGAASIAKILFFVFLIVRRHRPGDGPPAQGLTQPHGGVRPDARSTSYSAGLGGDATLAARPIHGKETQMKHGITAALALVGLTAVTGAHAQIFDNEAGWYVSGGVGEFKAEIDDFDDVDTTIDEFDSDDDTFKVFAGYRANRWLALELAYIDLGSPEDEILADTFATVEADGFAPYIVGTIPLGFFEVFAKAGYYLYDVEASVESPLGDFTDDDSESDFTYSVGVGLNFLERFNIRLEYEQFDFQRIDDSNALWLTGAFRF